MRFCLVALVALVMSACGGKPDPGSAVKKSSAAATMPAFGGDDAVAAVLESQGTPIAQLRFVLDSRPVAGQPFRLRLVVSASAPVAHVLVTVESDGLKIEPANASLELVENGSGGVRHYGANHDFTVMAPQDGLAEVTVHLATDADAPEALYLIPVLVAKPGATAPGKPSDKPDPAPAANHAEPKKG